MCYSRTMYGKTGFPSFGGISGLVRIKPVKEYQDRKRLKEGPMYTELGERYRMKLNKFLVK